ncbi:MAG: methyltransferase domain-containing protein [Actinomycetes bacterium]
MSPDTNKTIDCRICGNTADLAYPGTINVADASAMAPSNHESGVYADLYRCRDCGTVIQPSLPAGGDLHDLYRDMSDTAYLDEEAGRRATADRLLDMIGQYNPSGRLLDVGCGHGLLLDQAKKRGYDSMGLELSSANAAHARDSLGLDVREVGLEDFHDDQGFDVVVLADVIEHLTDPVSAIDHCKRLLAPNGVLCIITPDPSAKLARLAGSRWWGLVPAHTFLLPRLTLAELLSATGLVISENRDLVRTFAFSYWITGLADRGGPFAVLRPIAKSPLGRKMVSLPLGDEVVILAHRVEPTKSPNPLMSDRGTGTKVHVVLPAYNAAKTLPLVAEEIPADKADRGLVVDDHGSDNTFDVALAEGFDVLRHPKNRGYGANQKTCYSRAAVDGADIVVMVHADNQYDPSLLAEMVKPIEEGRADCVIGSRMLDDRAIAGGMPRWKWIGNKFLTWCENTAFRRDYSEYHTGYRAFSVDCLNKIAFLRNDDDFVFDQEIFAQLTASGARVVEIAIPTRYFLEASSVSFRTSVRYGLMTLKVLYRFRRDERKRDWPLLRPPAAKLRNERVTDSAAGS